MLTNKSYYIRIQKFREIRINKNHNIVQFHEIFATKLSTIFFNAIFKIFVLKTYLKKQPSKYQIIIFSSFHTGWTSLHNAAMKGYAALVEYLIKSHNATIDAVTMVINFFFP